MNCYKKIEVDETTPVQYVGVYVMHWQPEWGEPEVAFLENGACDDLLAACEYALDAMSGPDGPTPTTAEKMAMEKLRAAIAKAKGES